MDNALNTLFGKPDYSHIASDKTATISITAAEMSAVLYAYDRGVSELDADSMRQLEAVIAKLKDELHP